MGQGSNIGAIFTGKSLFDYSAYPASAKTWASWPATYMASSSYKYYGTLETIIRTLQPTGACSSHPRCLMFKTALQGSGLRRHAAGVQLQHEVRSFLNSPSLPSRIGAYCSNALHAYET